jgi:hypothetical protein
MFIRWRRIRVSVQLSTVVVGRQSMRLLPPVYDLTVTVLEAGES